MPPTAILNFPIIAFPSLRSTSVVSEIINAVNLLVDPQASSSNIVVLNLSLFVLRYFMR